MGDKDGESGLGRWIRAVADWLKGSDHIGDAGMPTSSAEEPAKRLPSPSEIVEQSMSQRSASEHGNDQTAATEQESFADRVMRNRQESGQSDNASGDNERLKVRSLPDEQRDRDKGRGR